MDLFFLSSKHITSNTIITGPITTRKIIIQSPISRVGDEQIVVPLTVVQFCELFREPPQLLRDLENDDLERDRDRDLDLPLCYTVEQIRRTITIAIKKTLFLDAIDKNNKLLFIKL